MTTKTPATPVMPSNHPIPASKDNFLAPTTNQKSWGPPPVLSPRDIIIPRVLLMQGMSDNVIAGKAKFGDLIDSVSGELLGSPTQTLDIIPFSMKKIIIVSEYDPKSRKDVYKEMIEATPENEALPWEDGNLKRKTVMSIFCLLPSELSKGGAIPKLISFRGTSYQAGKVIATQMYAINASANPWLPPPAFVMTLGVKLDKNDDGTFAVMQARRGREATPEEIASAFHWFESISANASSVKIDETPDEPTIIASAEKAFAKKPSGVEVPDPKGF